MGLRFNPVSVTDASTYSVADYNSGILHICPNFTSSCTITLPTAASGLEYTFISKAVAADAQNWVISTGSATNFFLGGVVHLDSDADAAGDEVVAVFPDGNSNAKLTVTTPGGGTRLQFYCDGTNWFVNGYVVSATAPAFADLP